MRGIKKLLVILPLMAALCLSGCDRPGYEQTADTEKALETYYDAVKNSVAKDKGTLTIRIRNKDEVVDKKETKEKYVYSYSTAPNGDESFDYCCYDEFDTVVSHYVTNEDGKVMDQLTGKALTGDKAEDFKKYTTHKSNPISSLQMFRMDANYKVQHSTISAIQMKEEDGKKVITVDYHGDKLTQQSIKNTGGLVRNIKSYKRVYTIENDVLVKIEIYARIHAKKGSETGVMETDTVVELAY